MLPRGIQLVVDWKSGKEKASELEGLVRGQADWG